jgi:hypothetical protein
VSAVPAQPPSPRARGSAFEISSPSPSGFSPVAEAPAPRVFGFQPEFHSGLKFRQGRREDRPPLRASQQGCLRAFAGMTPVVMATATAWVKFMQLNLWRAVSRYPFTLANDRFRSPAMS